jgi:type IV pilus assembly protein PilM
MGHFLTLNLGASKVALADYTVVGKGKLTLNSYGSCEIFSSDAESLSTALVPAIRQIMREKGMRPAPVIVSLSGQKVFPKYAKIPAIDSGAQLDDDIKMEVEQAVPFPIDDIVYDHQFLGETDDGDKGALIVASKLDEVRPVTDAIREAGLKLLAVDASPMAIYNATRSVYSPDDGCTVVLDIGTKTTNLVVYEGSRFYNRSIPVAGASITKEISQSMGCSLEEAEALKIERGYVSLGGVTEDEDEVADHVSKVIRTVLTRLHAEISRSINFYRSQQGGSAPSRLILTGGSVRIPQLDEFFANSLQIDVEYLNPFAFISPNPRLPREELENDAFTFAESAGLALRQIGLAAVAINLLPPELVAEAKDIKRIPFIATGVAATLAALGLSIATVGGAAGISAEKSEGLKRINLVREGWKKKIASAQKKVDEEASRSDELQAKIWARSKVLSRLDAVRQSLIPGMWIKEWTNAEVKADPSAKAAPVAFERAVITIRGWQDAMSEAEKSWAQSNKSQTVAEIVQNNLKNKTKVVDGGKVKIVGQKTISKKDVKGTSKNEVVEFTLQVDFVKAPSIVGEENSRKGGR